MRLCEFLVDTPAPLLYDARMSEYPQDTYLKRVHDTGCEGMLRRSVGVVHVDTLGRVGNGGWVAYDYRCTMAWDGCEARVLVTERAVRQLAAEAVGEDFSW